MDMRHMEPAELDAADLKKLQELENSINRDKQGREVYLIACTRERK